LPRIQHFTNPACVLLDTEPLAFPPGIRCRGNDDHTTS